MTTPNLVRIQMQAIAGPLVAPASLPASYDYLWRLRQQWCAAREAKLVAQIRMRAPRESAASREIAVVRCRQGRRRYFSAPLSCSSTASDST